MHPVVVLMAANFAQGFGEGFGSAFGEGVSKFLFGGGGSSSRLKSLGKQLSILDAKIDFLTSLVKQLPAVIVRIVEDNTRDEAYRFLTAHRDVYFANESPPLSDDREMIDLLAAWKTILAFEIRPKELTRLPEWTEYVRTRLSGKLDASMTADFALKVEAAKAAMGNAETEIDRNLRTAEAIGKEGGYGKRYFLSLTLDATPPVIAYVEETEVPTREISGGDRRSDRTIKIQAWMDAQKSRVRRLKAIERDLSGQRDELGALSAVHGVLDIYLNALQSEGVETASA